MRYSGYAFILLMMVFLFVLGCSGGNSPVDPGMTDGADPHSAAVATALAGVEIQNTILKELRLNGTDLLPWGLRELVLDPDGAYPLEIVLEGRNGEVTVEIDGATLLVDGEEVESFSGSIDRELSIAGLEEEIHIHLEVPGERSQVRDILVRTISTDHLPVGPMPGIIEYSDPETGLTVDIAENELLIGAVDGTPIEVVEVLVGALGCEIIRAIPRIDAYRVRFPSGESYEHFQRLFNSSAVIEYADLNAILYPELVPNDTYEDLEYGNALMQLHEAWDIHTGTDSTIIAVVDSGIMRDHPDLYENVINGEDFISPPGDGLGGETPGDGLDNNGDGVPDQNVGHGSHCAGIIGAVGNNSEGVSGHTWHTKLLPCRVFPIDGDSGAMDSWVVEAIIYAADQGADGISMSLGSYYASSAQASAISYAWSQGSVVVAAAGNSNTSYPHYPSAFNYCIAVAATTQSDKKAGFSNYADWVDVCAPGYQIASSIFYEHGGDPWSVPENQRYAIMSGTSMACPQVSGLVGLVASYFPGYTQEEVADQVIFTADNIDAINPGYEGKLGTGRINAYRALTTPLEPEFDVISLWSDDDHPLYSQGNRDGFLNPGETIEFAPTIKNIGLKGAHNCVMSLQGGGGLIHVLIGEVDLGYVQRGETVVPDHPLIFKVDTGVEDNVQVDLVLHFEFDDGDPIDLDYPLTIRKDLGVVDTITCSGEGMLEDKVAKGMQGIPALSFTIEGDLNYGTLDMLIVSQTGTAGIDDLGEVELWLDANDDGMFSKVFDTRIAYQSYDHPGWRGGFDELNDPAAGFGAGVDYEQLPEVYFNSQGEAYFHECVVPTAPDVPRTMFVVIEVLPTAETDATVQIGILSADDVIVRPPDLVSPIGFPIQSEEVPIVGTWLDPERLTTNGPSTDALYSWRAETAVCPVTGNVYVVFDSNRDGNFDIFFRRSTDQGIDFESPLKLDTSTANEFFPDVQVDSVGTVHVVYYSTKISSSRREIYFTRSYDNGVTFEVPVRLTNAVRDSRIPKLAVGPDDHLHIAWHDDRTGYNDYNIYYKQSLDGGDNWSDDLMVADTSTASEEAAIVVGGDGVIHVTWEELTSWYYGNVRYARSTDGGASFSSSIKITTGAYNNHGWHSDVGADDFGHVYVVFHYVPLTKGAEVSYRISDDSGANWGSLFDLTNNQVPDSRPAIHVMPDGSFIDIVFRSLEADTWNILHTFSEDGLGSWEEIVQISTSTGGDAREPVVVRAPNLNIFAFWEDIVSANGSYEVFYNRYIY